MLFFNSKRIIALLLCVLGLFGYVFSATNVSAQQANFGYSVDGYDLELYVVEPMQGENEEYFYGWVLNPNSGNNPSPDGHECVDADTDLGGSYDIYGQQTTFSCADSNDVSIYTSDFGQIEVLFEVSDSDGNAITDTTKTIDVGPSVDVSDSDGDGIIDANDPCPDDPDDTCDEDDENNDGGGEVDDGGDGDTEGLVNCGNPGADGVLQESEMCDYQALMSLVQRVINWLIGILVLAATLLFMYAGFLYLTAAGNQGQVDTAKEIFEDVAMGFLIVLLAFTLIATLVNLLTSEDWRNNWEEVIPIELSIESGFDDRLS